MLLCVSSLTTISRGGQHWGCYVQGHTPAFIPHNTEHGYNQTRWRRWPEACPADQVIQDLPKIIKPLPPTKKEADDDQPPPPPARTEEMPEPDLVPPNNELEQDLQPIPPDDARPEPPPGLTRPDAGEPAGTSPSDTPSTIPEEPPGGAVAPETPAAPTEGIPELAPPEETLEPAAPPATEPPTSAPPTSVPPTRVPATAPGTPLPVPPTDLDSRRRMPQSSPTAMRRNARPTQVQAERYPTLDLDAREAVFHDEKPRTRIPSQPARQRPLDVEQLPRNLEALPDEPPAGEELELFQPGAPRRGAAPAGQPAGVKPASYQAARLAPGRAQRASNSAEPPAGDAVQLPQRAAMRPALQPPRELRQRANPLRDGAGQGSYAEGTGGRANPLR